VTALCVEAIALNAGETSNATASENFALGALYCGSVELSVGEASAGKTPSKLTIIMKVTMDGSTFVFILLSSFLILIRNL
jgi:hypothetical protein